ncbi:MAG: DUF4417 domain-containing protein [Oscillospiraceae bacterium]|nr:DUF4417 domain-containing protein [Oscillospiraceae bacterium]
MVVEKIPIESITPYSGNSKKHTEVQLAEIEKSIDSFGFNDPIGVWGKDNIIVEGHGRFEALKRRGESEVDAIRLDHLTDEQRRAYGLVHNKLTLATGFDMPQLQAELDSLPGIEMIDFGFEFKEIDKDEAPFRLTGQTLENFFKHIIPIENEWGIPTIEPCSVDMTDVVWVNFNEKEKIKDPENTAIHFYIEDYQFNVVWTHPDKYLDLFKKCRAVVSPDFSNYSDMPKALQLYNTYRRQWCGRYWQDHGVNVICSLSWAQGKIEPWTFAGIPQKTMCAHSFTGERLDKDLIEGELAELLNQLSPSELFMKASNRDCKKLFETFDFKQIPPYNYKGAKRG